MKPQRKNASACDCRQPRIDSVLVVGSNLPEIAAADQRISALKSDIAKLKLRISGAESRGDDICLQDVLDWKRHGNKRNPPMCGIGEGKVSLSMHHGVQTAKEVLDWDGLPELVKRNSPGARSEWKAMLRRWKDIVRAELDSCREKLDTLKAALAGKENDLTLKEVMKDALAEDNQDTLNVAPPPPPVLPNPPEIPLFSKELFDVNGHNARTMSKRAINSLVVSEFNHRKNVQDAKMMGLQAHVLRMDFNCKIAKKICVLKGRGDSFVPFKSFASIQNEDALAMWWKGMKGVHKSTKEIEDDLGRLRDRLNQNAGIDPSTDKQSVKCVHVDNCCNVNVSLARMFPGALIKCDAFHSLVRWNDMLRDATGPQAGLFRTMMR